MTRLALALLLATAGCDSPSPAFRDAATREVEIDGSRFAVHFTRDAAEVYRISREWRPRRSVILPRAGRAIRQTTGCDIAEGTLGGDVAIQRAKLLC